MPNYSSTLEYFYAFCQMLLNGISALSDLLFVTPLSDFIEVLPGVDDFGILAWIFEKMEDIFGLVGINVTLGTVLFIGGFFFMIIYKIWRFVLTCIPLAG